MNLQNVRPNRPKLTLPFGKARECGAFSSGRDQFSLSDHELRRIVAAMIG